MADKDKERLEWKPNERILFVWDGGAWFARRVKSIEHDLDCNEKVYRCDEPIANDCSTLRDALDTAMREDPDRG